MQQIQNKALRLDKLKDIIKNFKQKVLQNNIILPKFVKIVELGPRDGLQNEKIIIPTFDKIEFINKLSLCGYNTIEVTSFVSPKWVPQMADNQKVYQQINKLNGVSYTALVPNTHGLEQALAAGVQEIAIFGAASEKFTKKNINCTIQESLEKFKDVVNIAQMKGIKIRGYVSTVMGCPYEGEVDPLVVAKVTQQLFDLGCYEVSLGDTIGAGTPEKTLKLFQSLNKFPKHTLAAHFHDTHGNAIENILVALENGISVIDSSVAGLGGCPYANTKAGNVCTENVLFTLHELGIQTGLDLERVREVGSWISQKLERENLCLLD